MKLKEKLADAYVRSTGMIIDSPVLADYLEAQEHYLAGFEKAREMAVKAIETKWDQKYYSRDCSSTPLPWMVIRQLGEEEV